MQQLYARLSASLLTPSSHPYNLTISHKQKFIWFRVAKVATRTIYTHLDRQGVILEVDHPYNLYYPIRRYEEYFKFAFVRNPWDRLISGWHNKIIDKNAFRLDPGTHRKLQRFDCFLSFLEQSNFLDRNIHFVPQSSLIDLNQLDYLGRLERFSEDFGNVCSTIGINYKEVKHRNRSEKKEDYRSYYSDAQAELVGRLYSKDVQLLGYRF